MSWRTVIVSNRCKLDLKLGYMMLAHPQMDTLFDFSGDGINTLVIEAPSFFRQFLQDISLQVSGLEGKAVLSQNNMPIAGFQAAGPAGGGSVERTKLCSHNAVAGGSGAIYSGAFF